MSAESLSSINYLEHIFPPELQPIAPDSEQYYLNKKSLVPFSSKEDKLSGRELSEHLNITSRGIQKRTQNPDVVAHRVYDILEQAREYVIESDTQLKILRGVYDEEKHFFESPDSIKGNSAVEVLLAESLLALESFKIKDWYAEDGEERDLRLEDIKNYIQTRDRTQLIHLCAKAKKIAKERKDFWETELATVITHPAVDDVNQAIAESHDPEELEIAA